MVLPSFVAEVKAEEAIAGVVVGEIFAKVVPAVEKPVA